MKSPILEKEEVKPTKKPNNKDVKEEKTTKKEEDRKALFNNKYIFKYQMDSLQFIDLFIHSSSNLIIVKDIHNFYLVFDFTLSLFYIFQGSKINVKFNFEPFNLGNNYINVSNKIVISNK